MKLNELRDNPGARQDRVRVGRGIGSGLGKTAGRGQKGQTSRSGVAIKGFEGGQMPLHMRLPKRGFNKPNRLQFAEVNVGALQRAIDAGKLTPGAAVDEAALVAAGLVNQLRDGVRLLGKGELKTSLTLTVSGFTSGARSAVEAAGGSVALSEKAAKRAASRETAED
ncbi:MAG: 50S ribosomal protein L15 [Sphingomonadaceae bacterium]